MTSPRALALIAALAFVVPLAACVERVETREVVVSRPPPAPVAEVVPAAPGPAEVWVWQPGHWRWDGREYVWQPGRYVERPHRAAQWVPPHWQERGPNWVFVAGHWR
jgi:WXXGXW repeat (2 copies)